MPDGNSALMLVSKAAPCGGHPVGQEIHEHEALGGGSGRRTYCRLTFTQPSLEIILRINLDVAFLISPMGLPLAAIWLLGKVQSLKFAIQDWVYG